MGDSLRAALGKESACQRVTEVLRPYKTNVVAGAGFVTFAAVVSGPQSVRVK